MGDILKKITELLNDGADIEQQRSTGIIIRSKVNWFDAIENDRRTITGIHSKAGNYFEDSKERKFTPQSTLRISEIP